MSELLGVLSPKDVTVSAVIILVAVAVITRKLVWHTDLKKAEARADRWEQAYIDLLTSNATAGVRAAEVAADVIAALPDPGQKV